MGNQNSTNSKPHSASTTPVTSSLANHESPRAPPPSSRRDPKNLNLIHSQRTTAAPPEPSQAQARGAVTHRTGTGASQSSNPVSQFRDARGSRNHHNHSTHSTHSTPSTHTNSSSNSAHMGAQQSKSGPKPVEQASQPVAVPVPISHTDSSSSRSHQSHSLEPSGPPATQDMSYHLTRPPRLPLPIEEEVHTPGSPIVANSDSEVEASVPTLDLEITEHEVLPRKSSALSSTTVEEDDDAEELAVDKTKATVPTIFEWRRGGDKVYVTGSIFQWNKKHRLHPVEGEPGLLRATIHVRPGTHHVRFLVDGAMQCSPDLPTTVDFGNNLVNYVEVSADDLPPDTAASATGTGAPVISAEETTPSDSKTEVESAKDEVAKPAAKAKPVLPAARYTSQIPQFLEDLDKAEDTQAYQYAAAAIEKLPTPPSLPGFLGKPILNANPPMKDDNSVLIMPNHTVLNHLTTSSIKNNVLAVAATTRYKRKYVTTIMYKPTGIGED